MVTSAKYFAAIFLYGLNINDPNMINESFMFCTHAHAATTSGPTGAGRLNTGSIVGIVGVVVAVIIGTPTVITAVYKFRKWWLKKEESN